MKGLENAELCIPSGTAGTHRSRYLLARAIIKRHLAVHLPDAHPNLQVNVFSSLKSSEFQEYLRLCPIQFVMAHDGSPKSITSAPLVHLPDADTPPADDDEKWTKILLRGMIRSFNVHELNVALINRIEFRDSKIFTMIVESFIPRSASKLSMGAKFAAGIGEAKKLLEESRETSDMKASFEDQDLEKVSEAFSEEDLSESYCLVTYAVSKILKQRKCDVFMASAFVLHSVIIKHIPLSQRRLPLITFDQDFEEQIESFMEAFSEVCRNTVEDKRWNELMSNEEFDCDSIDLVDGRLFRATMQSMCDNSFHGVVPRAAQPDWALLSGLVAELGHETLSLAGSIVPALSKSTSNKADFEDKIEALTVLPFTNSVFDKHLECINVKTEASLAVRFGAMKIYRETTHWHNHRKPLNPKYAPAPKVSKWRYENILQQTWCYIVSDL
jgi:ATP-dependent RNA helicase DDX60